MASKKEKYLSAAQKLIERRQFDKALIELAKVIQEEPNDTRTLLKMAELHAKQGANSEATDIYLRTGDLYSEQGFAHKAVAVYKNVLKLSPGNVAAHLKIGALFNQLGLISDAVQQYEAAAAALHKDKPIEAAAALRQAVEVQPDNVVLRVKLAESASHAGLVDEAARELGKVADQLKSLGRTDEYLRVMERLLFHEPKNVPRATELAEAYIARGNARQALPKLQAAWNADPRAAGVLSLLATALEQLGQQAKAVSVLKELIHLCEELGRRSERDAAILRALALAPDDSELREAASRAERRSGGGANESIRSPPPDTAMSGDEATDSLGENPSLSLEDSDAWSPTLDAPITASGIVPHASGRVTMSSTAAQSGASDFGVLSGGGDGEVERILAESDYFVKYGLLEQAADRLKRVLELDSESHAARETLMDVLTRLGRQDEAKAYARGLTHQQGATPPPIDLDGFDVNGVAPASLELGGPAMGAGAPVELEVSLDSGPGVSLAIDIEDEDVSADDVSAYVSTPPPEEALHQPAHASQPHSLAVAADEDFLIEEIISLEDQPQNAPPPLNSQQTHPGYPALLERDDLDTPKVQRRASRPERSSSEAFEETNTVDDLEGRLHPESDGIQSEDAFADAPVTVAAEPEQVATILEEYDENELVGELEQVSFFIEQAMLDEARALLKDVEARFPPDARVMVQLRALQDAEMAVAGATPPPITAAPVTTAPTPSSVEAETARIASPSFFGGTSNHRPIRASVTPTPRAVFTGGERADASTHVDLGIAYKGMGLYDAAISELKLACADPEHEVFALTVMGECYEAKNSFTEAVIRYKRALNCDDIRPEETLLLYFLLGAAFERLGDISEALYFYEKVLKREPKFRDVDLKVAELKTRLVKKAR